MGVDRLRGEPLAAAARFAGGRGWLAGGNDRPTVARCPDHVANQDLPKGARAYRREAVGRIKCDSHPAVNHRPMTRNYNKYVPKIRVFV